MTQQGKVRVGKRIYSGSGFTDPSFTGYKPIICLTKSTPYGSLGPYELKDEKNRIMENIWQGSKVYGKVPKIVAPYSRFNSKIIWDHPAETHVNKTGKLTKEYFEWRKKLMDNPWPVRYPVGLNYRHKCLYSIDDDGNKLNYIEARKKIYVPLYSKLVKSQKQFKDLVARLNKGENLLIIEVDGPHQESLNYYKEKYDVGEKFIIKDTILVNKKNMDIMLNDPTHPFGHGYCLGMSLLGMI